MHAPAPHSFEASDQLQHWLGENHSTHRELWVRIFKKHRGTPTVTWNDCVVAVIAWGWIDGQRESLEKVSFLQPQTPAR